MKKIEQMNNKLPKSTINEPVKEWIIIRVVLTFLKNSEASDSAILELESC